MLSPSPSLVVANLLATPVCHQNLQWEMPLMSNFVHGHLYGGEICLAGEYG